MAHNYLTVLLEDPINNERSVKLDYLDKYKGT